MTKTVKVVKEINYLESGAICYFSVVFDTDIGVAKEFYSNFCEASLRAKELVQKYSYILIAWLRRIVR